MSRDPLVWRSAVVAVASLAFSVAVLLGFDLNEAQRDVVVAGSGTVAVAVLALWSRRKVTPTSDPRNANGDSLTPVTDYESNPQRYIEVDPEEYPDEA